jgi:HEAT repeat protein
MARASVEDIAKLERSLRGSKDARQQERLVGPVFAALKTAEEKKAFLEMGMPGCGPAALQEQVFLRYAAKLLHDSAPDIRARAIYAVSVYRATEDIGDIEKLTEDPAPEVRAAAAFTLRIGGMKELPRIEELIQSDQSSEAQTKGLEGLGELASEVPSAEDRATLLAQIEKLSEQPDLKRAAISAFGYARLTDKEAPYLDRLATFVSDKNPEVRHEAIVTLGDINAAREAPAIMPALLDGDPTVRYAAARALGDLKDKRSIPGLERLFDDSDAALACESIRAVGKIGDASQAPVVGKLLSNPNDNLRRAAIVALMTMRAESHYPSIRELLHDPSYLVRCEVIGFIPQLYTTDAGTVAASMILDEDRSVRQAAEEMLDQLHAWDQGKPVELMVESHVGETHQDEDYLEAARRFITTAARNQK